MTRPRHPIGEIEDAVQYAIDKGWDWAKTTGHPWGKLLCTHHDREGCCIWVWSTPRNNGNHAKGIRRDVDRCPHEQECREQHEQKGGEE